MSAATNSFVNRATAIDAASGSVTSINGLTGAVILAAGTNISLTPVGNTITISASGTITQNGRSVTATTATVTTTDGIVNLANAGGICAVTGPTGRAAWTPFTLKDANGLAGGGGYVYTPASGTVDGQPNYVLANGWDSVDIYNDGTNEFTK